MSTERVDVDHVATLARLALTPDERRQLQAQLASILEHIGVIAEADTSQVPATAHIMALEHVLAADVSRPAMAPDLLLANAPATEDSYLRVRAVLDDN